MATVKKHAFDAKCLELAEYFLAIEKIKEHERAEVSADLAQEIQDVVEDFIMIERIAGRWMAEATASVGEATGIERTEVSHLVDDEGREVTASVKIIPKDEA